MLQLCHLQTTKFIMTLKATALIPALLGALTLSLAACKTTGAGDIGSTLSAGSKLVTAATLSDAEMTELGNRTTADQDRKYAKRLAKLTTGWKTVDGTKLDYKVYIKNDVNAFAVPNGAIRVYSALMDKFTDDELRYVLAHEIGHVMLGHSKKAFQLAYTTAAARDAAAASGSSTAATIANSQLGDMAEALINAQFSQSQENEADDYALKLLTQHKLNARGSVTALRKLETLYGNERSMFSSHPAPGERAQRMESQIAAMKK
jgi:putative metalloprotease